MNDEPDLPAAPTYGSTSESGTTSSSGSVPASSGSADWGYYPEASTSPGWVPSIGAAAIGWAVYGVGWVISLFVAFAVALSGLSQSKRDEIQSAVESGKQQRIEDAFSGLDDTLGQFFIVMLIAVAVLVIITMVLHKLFFGLFNSGFRVGFGASALSAIGGWVAGLIGVFGDLLIGFLSFGLVALICASVASGAILRAMAQPKAT